MYAFIRFGYSRGLTERERLFSKECHAVLQATLYLRLRKPSWAAVCTGLSQSGGFHEICRRYAGCGVRFGSPAVPRPPICRRASMMKPYRPSPLNTKKMLASCQRGHRLFVPSKPEIITAYTTLILRDAPPLEEEKRKRETYATSWRLSPKRCA